MKRIRLITTLTAILILYGCSSKDIDINGHWHSVTKESWPLNTLDIDDSITTTDKYQIEISLPNTYLRKDPRTGKLHLPFEEYTTVDTYSYDKDTLKITDKGVSNKYIKSNIEACELSDRYINSIIKISLSEYPESEDYDKLFYTANLFIGSSLKEEYERLKSSEDSIYIQAYDILIRLNEVSRYCNERESELLKDDHISLVLHADRQVNDLFIRKLVKDVPETISVYKAVTRGGELSVIKLNRD